MKHQDLRNIIKEEIRKVLKEAPEASLDNSSETMISSSTISPELAKVKTPQDLEKACAGKKLVIHSKYDLILLKKEKIPYMWIINGIGTNSIGVTHCGYMVHGLDIQRFATADTYTEYSVKFSIDDIFKFFILNKKKKNKIYVIDKFPIEHQMQEFTNKWKLNFKNIHDILGNPVKVSHGKDVSGPSYAILYKRDIGSDQTLQFTVNSTMYSFKFNTYSFDPRLIDSGQVGRAGYNRDEIIYKVGKKQIQAILPIIQDCISEYKNALNVLKAFYAKEHITAN